MLLSEIYFTLRVVGGVIIRGQGASAQQQINFQITYISLGFFDPVNTHFILVKVNSFLGDLTGMPAK